MQMVYASYIFFSLVGKRPGFKSKSGPVNKVKKDEIKREKSPEESRSNNYQNDGTFYEMFQKMNNTSSVKSADKKLHTV